MVANSIKANACHVLMHGVFIRWWWCHNNKSGNFARHKSTVDMYIYLCGTYDWNTLTVTLPAVRHMRRLLLHSSRPLCNSALPFEIFSFLHSERPLMNFIMLFIIIHCRPSIKEPLDFHFHIFSAYTAFLATSIYVLSLCAPPRLVPMYSLHSYFHLL